MMNEDASHMILAISKWLMVRKLENKEVPTEYFLIEAEHSVRGGLLGYILEGNVPWKVAPPIAHSRPWYGLFEAGLEPIEGELDVWSLRERGFDKAGLVIAQGEWDIVEELGDDEWVATPAERNGGGPTCGQWHVKILDKEGFWPRVRLQRCSKEPLQRHKDGR